MNQTPDQIREVISKVISAECAGKQIADERVIARHPDLAGALPDALQSASNGPEDRVTDEFYRWNPSTRAAPGNPRTPFCA